MEGAGHAFGVQCRPRYGLLSGAYSRDEVCQVVLETTRRIVPSRNTKLSKPATHDRWGYVHDRFVDCGRPACGLRSACRFGSTYRPLIRETVWRSGYRLYRSNATKSCGWRPSANLKFVSENSPQKKSFNSKCCKVTTHADLGKSSHPNSYTTCSHIDRRGHIQGFRDFWFSAVKCKWLRLYFYFVVHFILLFYGLMMDTNKDGLLLLHRMLPVFKFRRSFLYTPKLNTLACVLYHHRHLFAHVCCCRGLYLGGGRLALAPPGGTWRKCLLLIVNVKKYAKIWTRLKRRPYTWPEMYPMGTSWLLFRFLNTPLRCCSYYFISSFICFFKEIYPSWRVNVLTEDGRRLQLSESAHSLVVAEACLVHGPCVTVRWVGNVSGEAYLKASWVHTQHIQGVVVRHHPSFCVWVARQTVI